MTTPAIENLLFHAHLARHATRLGERDALYQRLRRGEITRVFRGCFVDTSVWGSLPPAERHRALAHLAAACFGDELVFSHRTAAALYRLPVLGPWPARVHVAGRRGAASDRTATLARHSLGIAVASTRIDGLRMTPLAVTVAQLAAVESFASGVVVADAALRKPGISRADLQSAAHAISLHHGGARALAVADFTDERADRPGESLSRVSMRACGFAMPDLQVELYGASGNRYFADFYWPELRLIGEFDGAAKYRDPEYLRGRTPEQALLDEKAREDDLRAADHNFSRWGWKVALSPALLGAQLCRAGVR
jgi:hypothetical protein